MCYADLRRLGGRKNSGFLPGYSGPEGPEGRGLGPRVIMGLAWSGAGQNLGLQARVMPAC
jgi:hypothetical protein